MPIKKKKNKTKRVISQKTRVCFLITRWMNNQVKGRRQATHQKRRESENKGAVAFVTKRITRCTRFSRNEGVSGKPDAKSLERNSKSSIHKVHATSREYPGQERTIAWKKYKSNLDISEVPLRYKIRGSVPRRD